MNFRPWSQANHIEGAKKMCRYSNTQSCHDHKCFSWWLEWNPWKLSKFNSAEYFLEHFTELKTEPCPFQWKLQKRLSWTTQFGWNKELSHRWNRQCSIQKFSKSEIGRFERCKWNHRSVNSSCSWPVAKYWITFYFKML